MSSNRHSRHSRSGPEGTALPADCCCPRVCLPTAPIQGHLSQQRGNAASHLLRLLVRYERHDIPQHRIVVGRSAAQRGQRALSVAQRAGDVAAPARVGQWAKEGAAVGCARG